MLKFGLKTVKRSKGQICKNSFESFLGQYIETFWTFESFINRFFESIINKFFGRKTKIEVDSEEEEAGCVLCFAEK